MTELVAHINTPHGRGRALLMAALSTQAIAITPEQKEALLQFIDDREIVLLPANEAPPVPDPTTWLGVAMEVSGYRPRPTAPPRPERTTALYRGAKGRGKVTWTDDGDVIVSRLKTNGAWKQTARHPWNGGNDEFKTNAALEAICGPDFIKED